MRIDVRRGDVIAPRDMAHLIETRDAAADSVRVRSKGRESVTIGARAASKLLVEIDR